MYPLSTEFGESGERSVEKVRGTQRVVSTSPRVVMGEGVQGGRLPGGGGSEAFPQRREAGNEPLCKGLETSSRRALEVALSGAKAFSGREKGR